MIILIIVCVCFSLWTPFLFASLDITKSLGLLEDGVVPLNVVEVGAPQLVKVGIHFPSIPSLELKATTTFLTTTLNAIKDSETLTYFKESDEPNNKVYGASAQIGLNKLLRKVKRLLVRADPDYLQDLKAQFDPLELDQYFPDSRCELEIKMSNLSASLEIWSNLLGNTLSSTQTLNPTIGTPASDWNTKKAVRKAFITMLFSVIEIGDLSMDRALFSLQSHLEKIEALYDQRVSVTLTQAIRDLDCVQARSNDLLKVTKTKAYMEGLWVDVSISNLTSLGNFYLPIAIPYRFGKNTYSIQIPPGIRYQSKTRKLVQEEYCMRMEEKLLCPSEAFEGSPCLNMLFSGLLTENICATTIEAGSLPPLITKLREGSLIISRSDPKTPLKVTYKGTGYTTFPLVLIHKGIAHVHFKGATFEILGKSTLPYEKVLLPKLNRTLLKDFFHAEPAILDGYLSDAEEELMVFIAIAVQIGSLLLLFLGILIKCFQVKVQSDKDDESEVAPPPPSPPKGVVKKPKPANVKQVAPEAPSVPKLLQFPAGMVQQEVPSRSPYFTIPLQLQISTDNVSYSVPSTEVGAGSEQSGTYYFSPTMIRDAGRCALSEVN
jgi:hypothetical protein